MAKLYTYSVNGEYKWYAIYTRLNHEKTVENALIEKQIEVFLPKRKVLREWSDRKKWIIEPLFRPYVFVKVSNKEYFDVLQIPSVMHYICFNGQAAVIQDDQIDLIKSVVDENYIFQVINEELKPAQKVRISNGPLKGYHAEIVSYMGKNHIQLKIDKLNYSIIVNLDNNSLLAYN